MQYMCLIYTPVDAPQLSDAEGEALFMEYGVYTQEARASGKMIAGEPLQPESEATTVRVRDGKTSITDGPFAETKEWLGGFYTFECATLDEALDWAARIPGAKMGSIEVRPLQPVPGRPVPSGAVVAPVPPGKSAYILLIYMPHAKDDMTQAEREAMTQEYMVFTQELAASGAQIASDPLQPTTTATTVRVRNGKRAVTDGPYAETKEWLAGYYLVACDSLEEAQKWAAKIPGARDGGIEVRPIMPIPAEVASAN
jgi:hypothetical protein